MDRPPPGLTCGSGFQRWKWKDAHRWLTDPTGRWHTISADGIDLFNPENIPITRYRYRGSQIEGQETCSRRSCGQAP